MNKRPYSLQAVGGPYAAIVRWTGDRYEIVEIYKGRRKERGARAKCVALNDAYEATHGPQH